MSSASEPHCSLEALIRSEDLHKLAGEVLGDERRENYVDQKNDACSVVSYDHSADGSGG